MCFTIQALVNAQNDHRYAGTITAVRGIIFLGTPHAGTSLAPYATRIANLLQEVRDANPLFVAHLHAGSPQLLDLHNQFVRLYGTLAIANFFEERKMKVAPYKTDLVSFQFFVRRGHY
jgi:hypothetical protein